MVPKGWSVRTIGEILTKVSDPIEVQPKEFYREIGIRSHGKGLFHKEPVSGVTIGAKRVFKVVPDCFVLNIVFAWEQAVARTTSAELGMIASHRFPQFQPKNNLCDIDYLLYFFKTPHGKNLLASASPGGAGRNKTLGQKEFARLKILLPPIREQIRIVRTLATWDDAIETIERLIFNEKQQRQALNHLLMTAKLRLPGFVDQWHQSKFSSLAKLASAKFNPKTAVHQRWCLELEHIVSELGAIGSGTSTNINSSMKSEFLAGDVLFGKLRPYLRKYWLADQAGVCSTEIWVLRPETRLCDPSFLFCLVQTQPFIDAANMSTGSRMPRADWSLVRQTEFLVPSLQEQQKIAKVLCCSNEIQKNLVAQLEMLKSERQSLMQQLLSGQLRSTDEKHLSVVTV